MLPMPTHVRYGTGRALSIKVCMNWVMTLSSPLCILYALTLFFNFQYPLMPCFETT